MGDFAILRRAGTANQWQVFTASPGEVPDHYGKQKWEVVASWCKMMNIWAGTINNKPNRKHGISKYLNKIILLQAVIICYYIILLYDYHTIWSFHKEGLERWTVHSAAMAAEFVDYYDLRGPKSGSGCYGKIHQQPKPCLDKRVSLA